MEELNDGQTSREDIESLLQIVLETTPPKLLALAESVARQESRPACFAAHSLKGSFATMGRLTLAASQSNRLSKNPCQEQHWRRAQDGLALVRIYFGEVEVFDRGLADSASLRAGWRARPV